MKKKGNTYLIKKAYVFNNAPSGRVILDIPGQLDGKQVELDCCSFESFGFSTEKTQLETILRFSHVNGVGAKLPRNCSYFAQKAFSLVSVDFHNVDPAPITTEMQYMFRSCKNLQNVDFGDLNTSNVSNMAGLFVGCISLSSILTFGSFETGNVTDMSLMFAFTPRLQEINLSNFNTQAVTNMAHMFKFSGVRNLNFGANFRTDNVTNMSYMFAVAVLLKLDISGFNTHRVADMSYMFRGCADISALDLHHIDTSALRNIHGLFENCASLQCLRLPSQGFRQDIQGADNSMFAGCYNLAQISEIKYHNGQVVDLGKMSVDNINRLHD